MRTIELARSVLSAQLSLYFPVIIKDKERLAGALLTIGDFNTQ